MRGGRMRIQKLSRNISPVYIQIDRQTRRQTDIYTMPNSGVKTESSIHSFGYSIQWKSPWNCLKARLVHAHQHNTLHTSWTLDHFIVLQRSRGTIYTKRFRKFHLFTLIFYYCLLLISTFSPQHTFADERFNISLKSF